MSGVPTSNNFPTESQSLQPRAQVIINGTSVNWISCEIENNNYYLADSFRIDIAEDGLPPNSLSDFIECDALLVNIYFGFPSPTNNVTTTGMASLILGQVDNLEYDPFNKIITLGGRDLTARFMDNKTSENFKNNTSSQVATILAQRRGLNPIVTTTDKKIGTYYQIDYDQVVREVTEWDLLTFLAKNEQFNVFVEGNNLHFEPQNTTQSQYLIPLTKSISGLTLPSANVIDIKFSHNKTIAKDVIVKVKSWNMIQAKAFTVTVTSTHKRGSKSFGSQSITASPQTYIKTIPNLTKDQATQSATKLAQEISKHEMLMEATLPGDNILTKQSLINVTGTQTILDQTYFVDSITRHFDFNGGYMMILRAKNHSPITQTIS
jgi:phage protein D